MKQNAAFCLTEVNYGTPAHYLVKSVAINPNNNAEIGVFDLSYDPSGYIGLSVEELMEVMKGKEKAIRVVRANNQPIVLDTAMGNVTIDDTVKQRIELIQAQTEFKQRLTQALMKRFEDDEETSTQVEESIYKHGFPTKDDENLMTQFHQAGWEEKIVICGKFQDKRFSELGLWLIYAENPDSLSEEKETRIR